MFKNLAAVRDANRAKGEHWFSRDSMDFFNTRIHGELINGRYFITSERMDTGYAWRYSIRKANDDGSIDTVGEFQGYATQNAARKVAERL